MTFLEILKTIVGSGNIIDSLTNAVDKFVTTDAEREALKIELEKIKAEQEKDQAEKFAQLEAIYTADTANAREMNNRIQESPNASWLSKNVSSIIALSAVLLTFTLYGIVLFSNIKPENKDSVIYILGALTSIVTMIFSFYYGSTVGGQKKTDALINNQKSA